MLKILACVSAVGLTGFMAVAATPEQPPLPAPETASVPMPVKPLVPVPDSHASPLKSAEPIVLYTNVKVEDLDNVPGCAISTLISIPDPCLPGCCRYIEICALPDCKPIITMS